MFVKPQSEHRWLDRLLGEWSVTSECRMGPDQPLEKFESRTSCKSLGGLWVVLEGHGDSQEGGEWLTMMTLGYDLEQKNYVGTFVDSMTGYLWLYGEGTIDGSGRKLSLNCHGPKCRGEGKTHYRDSIEIVDDDHWTLASRALDDDGNWQPIMTAHHRRKN